MNLQNDSVSLVLGETISDLLSEIVKLPYILEVRAISQYLNGEWIDFEILHNHQTEWDSFPPEGVRGQIQNLIINSEWGLRDTTGCKFYFDYQFYFGEFPPIPQPQVNELIAHTHQLITGAKDE